MTAIQLAGIAGLVFRMAVLAMGVVAITVTSSGRPYLIGFVVTYVIAEVCSFAAPIFVAPQSMPIVGVLLTLLGLANLLLMAVALIRESRTASDMLPPPKHPGLPYPANPAMPQADQPRPVPGSPDRSSPGTGWHPPA